MYSILISSVLYIFTPSTIEMTFNGLKNVITRITITITRKLNVINHHVFSQEQHDLNFFVEKR